MYDLDLIPLILWWWNENVLFIGQQLTAVQLIYIYMTINKHKLVYI